MDKVTVALKVFFEEPFWIGVFERTEGGELSACRVVFGAEPRDYDVNSFIRSHYRQLRFSPPVAAAVKSEKRNPKRVMREAHKQTLENGIGTTGAFIAPLRCANASLPHGRRNKFITPPAKRNRAFPTGNALLYISLLSVALIASFTSSAILNNLFAICNSRLLPTNQIVNCDGRVRPQGRTLFLFCI